MIAHLDGVVAGKSAHVELDSVVAVVEDFNADMRPQEYLIVTLANNSYSIYVRDCGRNRHALRRFLER